MKRSRLTPEQVQVILSRYPNEKAADLARDFDVPVYIIYSAAKRYGIKKSDEFMSSPDSGRMQPGQCISPETQFKKGQQSATKGKRIEAIIKNEQKLKHWRENCLWKKGHKPYNTGKDGDVRWRSNPGYYFIRISENKWEFLHRRIWEQKHGPVPEGCNIIFIDGDRRNCNIENLRCVSNAELAEMNRHTKYPIELRRAIELNNKLKKTIKKHESAN